MIGAMFWAMNSIIERELLGQRLGLELGARCAETNGVGSSMTPRMTAIFLMISETPCRASRAKPASRIALAGQMIRPPALVDTSPLRTDRLT